MIVTATPNPAWDISYRVERLRPGAVHQVDEVRQRPGGKGVNVASVLSCMGERASLLLPLGGVLKQAFAEGLSEVGLQSTVIESPVPTRRSVTIQDDGDATLLNEPGNPQPPQVWDAMVDAVRANQSGASVLTVSGSLPPQTPLDFLSRMVQAGHEAGMKVVLDCRGPELWEALSSEPDLVRLNLGEAAATTGLKDQRAAAQALLDAGARVAVVSSGKEGALLLAKGMCCPDGGELAEHQIGLRAWLLWRLTGNATGAGDALTAALAMALEKQHRQARAEEDAEMSVAGEARPALVPVGTGAGVSGPYGGEPSAACTRPGACPADDELGLGGPDDASRPSASGLVGELPQQKPAHLIDLDSLSEHTTPPRPAAPDGVDAPGQLVHDWARALRAGVAWSAAAVLQPTAGVISRAHAEALRGDVVVEVLT